MHLLVSLPLTVAHSCIPIAEPFRPPTPPPARPPTPLKFSTPPGKANMAAINSCAGDNCHRDDIGGEGKEMGGSVITQAQWARLHGASGVIVIGFWKRFLNNSKWKTKLAKTYWKLEKKHFFRMIQWFLVMISIIWTKSLQFRLRAMVRTSFDFHLWFAYYIIIYFHWNRC